MKPSFEQSASKINVEMPQAKPDIVADTPGSHTSNSQPRLYIRKKKQIPIITTNQATGETIKKPLHIRKHQKNLSSHKV